MPRAVTGICAVGARHGHRDLSRDRRGHWHGLSDRRRGHGGHGGRHVCRHWNGLGDRWRALSRFLVSDFCSGFGFCCDGLWLRLALAPVRLDLGLPVWARAWPVDVSGSRVRARRPSATRPGARRPARCAGTSGRCRWGAGDTAPAHSSSRLCSPRQLITSSVNSSAHNSTEARSIDRIGIEQPAHVLDPIDDHRAALHLLAGDHTFDHQSDRQCSVGGPLGEIDQAIAEEDRGCGCGRKRQLTGEVPTTCCFDDLPRRARAEAGLVGKEIRVRHGCSIGTLGERLEETLRDRQPSPEPASLPPGRMPEWTNGTVSNTVEVLWVSVGSNPTPSAKPLGLWSHRLMPPGTKQVPVSSTRMARMDRAERSFLGWFALVFAVGALFLAMFGLRRRVCRGCGNVVRADQRRRHIHRVRDHARR